MTRPPRRHPAPPPRAPGLPSRASVLLLALALAIGLGALAAGRAPAGAPPADAGSFRLGTIRILGVPVITVASPAVGAGGDTGPDAAERARVIEGNLSQLYQPGNPCTPGERVGEALLDHLSQKGSKAACDPNHLGLLGSPKDLRVVLLEEPNGGRRLAALVAGRASPFPLLTVTDQDAQFNGRPAAELAEPWRVLLERRLRSARRVFEPDQIDRRERMALGWALALALLMALVVGLWHLSQRLLPRLQRLRVERAGRFDGLPVGLTQWLSRLLAALVLLLGVAMGAVLLLAWPGQIPAAIDVLLQPLVVLMKAVLLLAAAAVLPAPAALPEPAAGAAPARQPGLPAAVRPLDGARHPPAVRSLQQCRAGQRRRARGPGAGVPGTAAGLRRRAGAAAR
jgi:small conductance mechanosensitive channel